MVLLLWLCCTMSVVSQTVVALFDDGEYVEQSVLDTLVTDTLVADTLALDTKSVDALPSIAANTSYSLPTLSAQYRSDVRHIRDSLKHAMRLARGAMHKNVHSQ